VPVDRLDELREPSPDCAEVRTIGVFQGRSLASGQHLREISRRLVRARAVRLVHDEHVGDLDDAGLDRLDVVAETRDGDETDGVDHADDIDLLLADATVSTRTTSVPSASRTLTTLAVARARPPACPRLAIERMKMPSSGIAPRIADPVAEDRAAGERARGIDRDDGDARCALAVGPRETIDERGLAAPWRSR